MPVYKAPNADLPQIERSYVVVTKADSFLSAELTNRHRPRIGKFTTHRWAAPSPTPTVLSFDPVEKTVYWIHEDTNSVFRTSLLDATTMGITGEPWTYAASQCLPGKGLSLRLDHSNHHIYLLNYDEIEDTSTVLRTGMSRGPMRIIQRLRNRGMIPRLELEASLRRVYVVFNYTIIAVTFNGRDRKEITVTEPHLLDHNTKLHHTILYWCMVKNDDAYVFTGDGRKSDIFFSSPGVSWCFLRQFFNRFTLMLTNNDLQILSIFSGKTRRVMMSKDETESNAIFESVLQFDVVNVFI
ncbi:uncharacterized protein [Diadema setosum]|uniref:uncharacterized protein isoform X2 n=1 Tax=Diadema setosum TaxID=31175 RepID=UPI003B3B235B